MRSPRRRGQETVVARTETPETDYDRASPSDVLGSGGLDSNVLVVGPTLSNKDQLAYDLLARSWANGVTPFAITATDAGPEFRSRFETFVPPGNRVEDVYVVDCAESSRSGEGDERATCDVGTPADLTGIGICLSKGYDGYGTGGRRRILLDNLSTLLIYSDIDRVYRFLSTINSRVTEVGDVTIQLLDEDALDSTDRNTLLNLFSTIIEVRTEANTTLFRVHGDTQSEWYEYLPRPERDHA
jgi:KaiC/GvpD/RAD55 family RecA-like ATPase